ncbi:hypothetical protein D9M68_578790 [compost metagenome]
MTVGQRNQLPNINIKLIADNRQFVGKCDIDVTKAIFGEFGHFGCTRIRNDTLAFYKNFVEGAGRGRTLDGHATNHSVVLHQLSQNMARQNTLRAMGNTDI